jgi:Mrp family chromosome partitioning ATPase
MMGCVLEALRHLENKPGTSSAGSAPVRSADTSLPQPACPPTSAESLGTIPAGEPPAAPSPMPSAQQMEAVAVSPQTAIYDTHLAPTLEYLPPEYLPDAIVPREGDETPVAVAEPRATAGLSRSADDTLGQADADVPSLGSEPTVAVDNLVARGAYDELAATILTQIVPERPAALWFTSVEEGIGRTAMVASLAEALARRQSQGVLVVDADFRRPNLATHFGVAGDPGLAGVLDGRVTWEEAIAATAIPSLFVLPAGRSDAAPTADRLAPLLEQWGRRFRLVLLDAPALGQSQADCLVRHFHGVYLALRLGQTRQRALRRGLQALEAAGGRLLGSILLGPAVTG